ncbi:MAG: anthranilate synthase component II [Muribaculaceae bacterium]
MSKLLIVDNYDSFTYNLAHAFRELGEDVTVLRNDKFNLPDIAVFDRIVLSPGPGIPKESGLLLPVIREYAGVKPIFGVCLGEQAMSVAFGGSLINLSEVFHGVQTPVTYKTDGNTPIDPIFAGLPNPMAAGRYHSWVVDSATLPDCLEVTATSAEGQIMGLRHRSFNMHGIQFHPESVLTPDGMMLMRNWLNL